MGKILRELNLPFLRTLDDQQEIFMAAVHCDQIIYLEDPAPYIARGGNRKGAASRRA